MISSLANSIPGSGIREMMRRAAGIDDVIHLEVGEPSFPTPNHIIEAAVATARAGRLGYTPTAGIPDLREAVAARVSQRWGRVVAANEVLISCGAVGALTGAVLATVSAGDELLLPDPGWPNYHSMALISGATPRFYHLRPEDGYLPDLDEVAELISSHTKAILINTPGNPTGAVFPADVMQNLGKLASHHGIKLISDEIYEDLVFDGVHTSAARDDDGAIYVSGCSKSYAMTGWRIGFVVAPAPVISAIEKIQEPLVSCAPAVSQGAALAALQGPQDCVEEMRDSYRRRRNQVCSALSPSGLLPVVPAGAFYALVDMRQTGMSGMGLAQALLDKAQVATAPGATFGPSCEHMVRVSLAASEADLAEGCRRLLDFSTNHCRKPSVGNARDNAEVEEAV